MTETRYRRADHEHVDHYNERGSWWSSVLPLLLIPLVLLGLVWGLSQAFDTTQNTANTNGTNVTTPTSTQDQTQFGIGGAPAVSNTVTPSPTRTPTPSPTSAPADSMMNTDESMNGTELGVGGGAMPTDAPNTGLGGTQ